MSMVEDRVPFVGRHPLFHFHVDVIRWIDDLLDLDKFANEVVIDFTGEVRFKFAMFGWLMLLLLPMVVALPVLLLFFFLGASCKYGSAPELLPVFAAAFVSGVSYYSLISLACTGQFLAAEQEADASYVELLACPVIGLITCLAFLSEIFLLRVEDAAAAQVREQLLSSPQAKFTGQSEGGKEKEHTELHSFLSLLRHMSQSLRRRANMESIFKFSVIEQILCSETRNWYHDSESVILANMRRAPKGPSPTKTFARRGKEPMTLVWTAYVKARAFGFKAHRSSLMSAFVVALLIAFSPMVKRWWHGNLAIPTDHGFAVWALVIVYPFISFFGLVLLLMLSASGNHRFSHLKRCLVVILYLSGTDKFRPALHAGFFGILREIMIKRDDKSSPASILSLENPDGGAECNVVRNFAARFVKQRELSNVGDARVSVKFPTLSVNKFFMLRTTIRTLVAAERLRQQLNMCGIFLAIVASVSFGVTPLVIHSQDEDDEYETKGFTPVLGFLLFCLCCLPLAVMLNEAVAMNNIMQEQSIGSLKSWHMEVQEVHWTLQAHSKLQPVSENRLLLDNYFHGLLEPYSFMEEHIRESEKPINFLGLDVTAGKRNQILATVGSSAAVFFVKILSEHIKVRNKHHR